MPPNPANGVAVSNQQPTRIRSESMFEHQSEYLVHPPFLRVTDLKREEQHVVGRNVDTGFFELALASA